MVSCNYCKSMVCANYADTLEDIMHPPSFPSRQTHEIRQLVWQSTVIVLVPRSMCLIGILFHLTIMVQLRYFHQAVNHFLTGFQHSWSCWEMVGGALSGVQLVLSAVGENQQGRCWVNQRNLTFCLRHLIGFWLCPKWPMAMQFYKNPLLNNCEVLSTVPNGLHIWHNG